MNKELRQNSDYNLYRKTDYSRNFDVSRPTIDRKIKDGELETVEVGGVTFIKVKIDKMPK